MKNFCVILLGLSLFSASAIASTPRPIREPFHAQNLGETSRYISDVDGLATYQYQLGSSKQEPNNFKRDPLPNGLSKDELVNEIAPNEDKTYLTIAAAKPYPYQKNRFAAIVQFSFSSNIFGKNEPFSRTYKKSYELLS